MKSLVKSFPKDNLTKSEREALNNLQQRDSTIITKANKGDAMVIMDVEDYIKKANRQLSDTNNYQKLNIYPLELHTEKNKAVINNYEDDEQLYIIKNGNIAPTWQDSNTGLSSTTKNSGRSAISYVDCHTSRTSEFVDHYLQPAVTNF